MSREATGEIADAVNESLAGGTETFDHADWGALLAAGTRSGLVDYAYFKAERPALESYLGRIAEADLGALAPEQLKALLINAYNAYTVLSILDHPDVESIRDIDGVSDVVAFDAGEDMTCAVEADGELLGTLPARFELVPHALRVLAP